MDIYQLRCPKITDIYKLTLKDWHFSTAAMFSILKNFPRYCRWWFCSSIMTTGSQIMPFMVIILHIWAGFKHILKWKHMYFRELEVIQGGWIRVLVLCIRSLLVEINRTPNLHRLKQWREFIITPEKARDCWGIGKSWWRYGLVSLPLSFLASIVWAASEGRLPSWSWGGCQLSWGYVVSIFHN